MKLDEKINLALLIWNVMIFLIYGIDKSKARRRAWRIPEKILLILAFWSLVSRNHLSSQDSKMVF